MHINWTLNVLCTSCTLIWNRTVFSIQEKENFNDNNKGLFLLQSVWLLYYLMKSYVEGNEHKDIGTTLKCNTANYQARSRKYRWVQGEKFSKDTASLSNLISTIGAQASPKRGMEPGVRKGKRSLMHATSVANAPWKPLTIRWRSSSVSRSGNWKKVWSVGKSLLAKGQNAI